MCSWVEHGCGGGVLQSYTKPSAVPLYITDSQQQQEPAAEIRTQFCLWKALAANEPNFLPVVHRDEMRSSWIPGSDVSNGSLEARSSPLYCELDAVALLQDLHQRLGVVLARLLQADSLGQTVGHHAAGVLLDPIVRHGYQGALPHGLTCRTQPSSISTLLQTTVKTSFCSWTGSRVSRTKDSLEV